MKKKKEDYPIYDNEGLLKSKKQWMNLIKGPKGRLSSSILLILLISFGLVYVISILLNSFKELISELQNIFYKNLGTFSTTQFLQFIILSIFFSAVLIGIIWFLIKTASKKQPNKWFILALFIMFFIFLFGMFGIDSLIKNPPQKFNLFDEENVFSGIIICKGYDGMSVGQSISCETKWNLKRKDKTSEEIFVELFSQNLTRLKEKKLENGFFISEGNVTYISFTVYEYYSDNSSKQYSVGYPFSFISEEKFEQNKLKFIQYALGLIAVIFISIPLSMVNLRNLWRNK